jgi:hypothetical protein
VTALPCKVHMQSQAEKHLRASNLTWTIVRPGGLSNTTVGNVIFGKEDTFLGLESDPGRQISRELVCFLSPQVPRCGFRTHFHRSNASCACRAGLVFVP